MSVLARAVVRIEADIADFDSGLALVGSEMEKTGKHLEELGHNLMLKVTLPLAALGGLAVHAFGEQQDAIAKVNAVLEATGHVAGTTTAEIVLMAEAMQDLTRFDNDAVIAAAGLLATFQQIRNEMGAGNAIFDRAIASAVDLAAVMGTDLETATVQLGRALEDPATGLMLLRRAGVQFSAAEQAMIKVMVSHNQLLEAQRLILEKVEGKTKGVAEAMAQTPLGHFAQAWHEVQDALKPVGALIVQVLVPLADMVRAVAKAFKESGPEIINFVTILATIVATVPVIITAIAAMIKAWVGIKAIFLLVGGSTIAIIALIVAAFVSLAVAGVALYKNWGTIKLKMKLLWLEIEFAAMKMVSAVLNWLSKIPGFGGLIDDEAWTEFTHKMHNLAVDIADTKGAIERDLLQAGDTADGVSNKIHHGKAGKRPPEWVGPAIEALDKLQIALEGAAQMEAVLGDRFDLAAAQAQAYQGVVQALQAAHIGLNDTISAAATQLKGVALTGFNQLLARLKALDPQLDVTKLTLGELIERIQQLQDQSATTAFIQGLDGIQNQVTVLGARFDATSARAQAYSSFVNQLIGQHHELNDVIEGTGMTLEQLIETTQRLQDEAQIGQFYRDQFTSASDAIVDFMFDTKKKFSDFVNALLQEWAKFVLRLEMLKLLTNFGSGGMDFSGEGAITGHAHGGFIGPGELGLVGEQGPELVMAGRSGMTVSPLREGRNASAGVVDEGPRITAPVSISVQAMDSRDVQRFFQDNDRLVGETVARAIRKSSALQRGSRR